MKSARASRAARISRESPVPLYHQIELDLANRIRDREWGVGEQIPTEVELCDEYDASRMTIRQAVGNLVGAGALARRAGRGTFVQAPMVTAGPRGLTSFTEEMAVMGMRAGARVLKVSTTACPSDIAIALRIREGDPANVVSRLRLADDEPIGLQKAYLPVSRIPKIRPSDLADRSLYALLRTEFGIEPREAEETFVVEPISGSEAQLLQVGNGSCGWRVERITFDSQGPFEFVTSLIRGDRYQVRLGLRPM